MLDLRITGWIETFAQRWTRILQSSTCAWCFCNLILYTLKCCTNLANSIVFKNQQYTTYFFLSTKTVTKKSHKNISKTVFVWYICSIKTSKNSHQTKKANGWATAASPRGLCRRRWFPWPGTRSRENRAERWRKDAKKSEKYRNDVLNGCKINICFMMLFSYTHMFWLLFSL